MKKQLFESVHYYSFKRFQWEVAKKVIKHFFFQIRLQILDANQYELLLERGLDFFGAVRFGAVPERYWREGFPSTTSSSAGLASCNYIESSNAQQNDGVLQCYRCQGFWHVAANCRHLQRCVRCGEPHSVEFCPRPRNNPVCCHCSGPHHAGLCSILNLFLKFKFLSFSLQIYNEIKFELNCKCYFDV